MALEEHTEKLSHPNKTLLLCSLPSLCSSRLSSSNNLWQVLAEGDLASINLHAQRLPGLEHKQREGPSAAGGLVLLVKKHYEACMA